MFHIVKVHSLSWLDFDDIWDWLKAALDIGDLMSKRLQQLYKDKLREYDLESVIEEYDCPYVDAHTGVYRLIIDRRLSLDGAVPHGIRIWSGEVWYPFDLEESCQ